MLPKRECGTAHIFNSDDICITCGVGKDIVPTTNVEKSQEDSKSNGAVGYVSMLDEERRWILGRPCFVLASTARRLRKLGHKIETSAEDEQAVVIDWMLWMYEKYGKAWRDKIEDELK